MIFLLAQSKLAGKHESTLEALDAYKDLQDGFFDALPESAFEYVTCPFGHTDCHPLFSKGSMRVVRCSCGFVYNRRQARQEVLDEFYKNSAAANKWVEIKGTKKEFYRQNSKYKQAVDFLKKSNCKSIADIGCGNGAFLASMKGVGVETVHGFEMNDSAIEAAKSTGAWIQKGDLKYFINDVARTYDAVSLWGVLEHLKNPLESLKAISNNISDGGRIAVCVPNVNSLLVRTLWQKAFTFCPQHLWYFSEASLSALFRLCGFNLEFKYTIESESVPLLKHMYGFDPYQSIPAWAEKLYLKQEWVDIMDQRILGIDDGYKIVMIGRKNAHSDNSSEGRKQKHKKQKSSKDWPKLVS